MIRRTALVSAAAATLVLAPTAAFAYDAPGFQGELSTARLQLEESIAIWRELGDKEGLARSLFGLGNVAVNQGDEAVALSILEEARVLLREVGDKPSVVIGYAMTEKQGGSDLRETQTTARFSHSADYHGKTAHWYELTGHKWFCSVPQSDGFFTLPRSTAR